jgi:biotin transport system substrate-specific component
MNQTKTIKVNLFPVVEQNVITQALWITAFTAVTAVGAQIEIPHQPVPYTMQTFFVLLSGAMLGRRNGSISQFLYLMIGALGIPVFSQFGFGIARLFGPSGGYLLSFPFAAFSVGYLLEKNKSYVWSLLAMIVGAFIIFTLGTLQLNLVFFHNWKQSFLNGFLIFSWWDMIKIAGAAAIAHQLRNR